MTALSEKPSPDPRPAVAALELQDVTAGYGTTTVLRHVSLNVPANSVVALLGANGAGKTTLLKCAAGFTRVQQGTVHIGGEDHTGSAAHRRVKAGLCLIPEGRGIWRSLSVRENLRLQTPPWGNGKDNIDKAAEVFPALAKKLDQPAGTLSGGQQQMVALCRAYLSAPKLVLLDEVSMGLAPKIVDEIFESLSRLRGAGLSLLLVEQYVERALELADHVVLLRRGEVVFSGQPGELDQRALIDNYLGQGDPVIARAD